MYAALSRSARALPLSLTWGFENTSSSGAGWDKAPCFVARWLADEIKQTF